MSTTTPLTTVQFTLPTDLYNQIEEFAKQQSRSADEVVRDALEQFSRQRFRRGISVLDIPRLDLGTVLKPLGPDDDLLEEMLEGKQC